MILVLQVFFHLHLIDLLVSVYGISAVVRTRDFIELTANLICGRSLTVVRRLTSRADRLATSE
jgi:hypothetical protein